MARTTRLQLARKAINKVAFEERKAKRREKLILDHQHVVIKIADQISRKMTHLDLEDLRQAGFMGLIEAADRYKPRSGVFEHYCYFRVRGAMIDAHKRTAYKDDTLILHSIDEVNLTRTRNGCDAANDLPKIVAIDGRPLPDEMAAKREQARLLAAAVGELDADERRVFIGALTGVPLIQTARECGRSIAWARVKLASARAQLGARVQMWGLGLDRAA